MSQNNRLNPGSFKINLFELSSRYSDLKLDLSNFIYSLSIHESLNLSSIRGNVTIVDSANILNRFNLSGEEIIKMVYEDCLGTSQTLWLSLYAISDAKPNEQGTGMAYKLHFTSVQKFVSDSKKISKSYRGKISEIAQQIYEEYFDAGKDHTKPFSVENTEGIHQLIVPNLHPCKAMEFLARRSYSSESVSQTFRFWEDRFGYHLRTIDDLVSKSSSDIRYTYSPMAQNDGEGLAKRMAQVISMDFPNVVDSYSAMVGGQYKRSVRELDIIEQNVIKTDLKYSEVFNNVFSIADDRVKKHSDGFVSEFLEDNDVTSTVIKDYREGDGTDMGIRANTFYPDIINHKSMMLQNVSESSLRLKVYGRNDLKIGEVISLDIFENDGTTKNRKLDKRLGGKYMIESISHSFVEEVFVQTVSLVRNDWGKV